MNRFMIAGTKSGCGKTTVTCAVLAAMKARGLDVCAFKAGPDYIDPGFHRSVMGVPSHNLDSFFCTSKILCTVLGEYSRQYSVIEGVMGFYDGGDTSAHRISEITETPAVIVIDCQGMSDSVGAVMNGFLNYCKPSNIAGFIFNRLPQQLAGMAKELCQEMGTEFFGTFPRCGEGFHSRHLGLIQAQETEDIQKKLSVLAERAEECLNIDALLNLTGAAPKNRLLSEIKPVADVTIAVASDSAFSFTYPENLDILRKLGCRTVIFSPLEDSCIPQADGLILSGGYPELHLKKLSGNTTMLESVRQFCKSGKPFIAECGGYMYLTGEITAENGSHYPMAGVFPGECARGDRLRNFGYVTLIPEEDSLLFRKGSNVPAHEFHYWQSSQPGEGLTAQKRDGRSWRTGHTSPWYYAGFPHLYFPADISLAKRFVKMCAERKI